MTDQINQITDTDSDVEEIDTATLGRNKRRMFIAGAGLAGAAAIVGKSGTASANGPGQSVLLGNEGPDTGVGAGTGNESVTTTEVYNTGTSATRDNNALKGSINDAGNNSHAILGTTIGDGHAIAGVVGSPGTPPAEPVAATWGLQYGEAAAIEGDNRATGVDIAGDANGVRGIVLDGSNGSHAVIGVTAGAGHSVAGDTPSDAAGPGGTGRNSTAATWGRHAGVGAGVGGVNINDEGVDIAGPARGVEGVVTAANNGSHAVFGATSGGGHSIAGDTPADAAGPGGVGPNTTAATWGRHGGVGAGIGGVSAEGYGGEFIGGRSHIRLIQDDTAPAGPPTTGDHLLGELYADGAGDLFYNTADGDNWVPLTQGGAGGTVLFDDPSRASDTRAGSTPPNTDKTKYAAGTTRVVDLTLAGFPAGATAALINLTVVNVEGVRGFATVFNGDTDDSDRPNTSNINWTDSTGVIANSATVRPNADGEIKIYTSQATDVIVDIQGYIA